MKMHSVTCVYLMGSVLFLQTACTPGEEFHFQTFADLEKSDVYADWLPDFIPKTAREIDVWYDVESSLVRASFTFDGKRPVFIKGMRKLGDSKLAIAKNSYPKVQDLKMTIFYSCEVKEIGTKKEPLRYTEAVFIGDTGRLVFYWNSMSKDIFHQICDDHDEVAVPNLP